MKTTQINSLKDLAPLVEAIREEVRINGSCSVVFGREDQAEKKRTLSQNASLHKYCSDLSGEMNAAGFTQRQLVGQFKDGFELPVTMEMIKEIFREVGRAMFKKDSTKGLSTIEVQKVYQVVDQRFGEITGIRREWPSIESQTDKARGVVR